MKKIRTLMLLAALFSALMLMQSAAAPAEGWNTSGSEVRYYISAGSGLVPAVGLRLIGEDYYYFDASGVMQTEWVQTADGWRYFMPAGTVPEKGKMFTGFQKIGSRFFYFDMNGVVKTGLIGVGRYTYFFKDSGDAGVYGQSVMNGWAKYEGERYYFNARGRMIRNSWVKNRYVGPDGKMLKNTVTPDGYLVGANGKKTGTAKVNGPVRISGVWHYFDLAAGAFLKEAFATHDGNRYYADADGILLTGWQKINNKTYFFNKKGVAAVGAAVIKGKTYYFNKKGVLQISKTVNGYTTDENGMITAGGGKGRVLVVSGHGQGDSGAVSSLGQEYLKTREFAKLIVTNLKAAGVDVTFYQNGSTSYDLYQRNGAALGTYASSSTGIKGTGSYKKLVKSRLKTGTGCAKLWEYDYVLEVHFNATGYASKDEGGDGQIKGFGIYINQYKSAANRKIDQKIVTKVRSAGMPIWARGTGIFTSAGLLNARTCQELSVNYSLIETAFIDDRDDMNFYNSHKNSLAQAVASAIAEFVR